MIKHIVFLFFTDEKSRIKKYLLAHMKQCRLKLHGCIGGS